MIDDRRYILNAYHEFSKIRYIEQLEHYEELHKANPNLYALQYWNFYLHAIDNNTVYIKLDDDIMYLNEDCIENILKARFKNSSYLLVYATIINNPLTDVLLEK